MTAPLRTDAARIVAALLLTGVFIALTALPSTAAAKRQVVTLGTIAPEGSSWHDALLRIRERWRGLSGGAVELRIFAGGVLGGETEMIRKVRRGSLDAVAVAGPGLLVIDPALNCLNLPLFASSYEEFDFVRDRIGPELEARLETQRFKLLSWADAGWIYFFTKTPVRTPDELRRVRLWTSTGAPDVERLFKQFGFRVVPLPATEMLTGLQSGLIDAVVAPPLFALIDGSYRAAPYMTDLRWAPLNAATLVSTRAWSRVPAELRPQLIEAARKVALDLRTEFRAAEGGAVAEMKARGLEVLALTDAERRTWYEEAGAAYPKLRDTFVEGPLFDRVMALREEFRRSSPQRQP